MTVRPLSATLTSRTNRKVTDNVPIFNPLGLTVKEVHELYPLLTEKNAMASLRLTVPPRQTVKPVATTAAYLGKGASNQVDSDRITRKRMRRRGYLTLFESVGRLPAAHEVGGICTTRSNRSCASLSLRSGPTL